MLHYLMPILPVERGFSFHKYENFFNPLLALYCGQWLGALVLLVVGASCGKVKLPFSEQCSVCVCVCVFVCVCVCVCMRACVCV